MQFNQQRSVIGRPATGAELLRPNLPSRRLKMGAALSVFGCCGF